MKVLLRQLDDKYYVWKDAQFKNNKFDVDDFEYPETSILAAKCDDGEKFVRCKYCDQVIENTPEAIERHFTEKESEKDCMNCQYLRICDNGKKHRVITKNANGSYNVTETYDATLQCRWSWTSYDTDECNRKCVHRQHRERGVEMIGGVLLKYPDLFERQITVEVLKSKGYKFTKRRGSFFYYDMKLRNTMSAVVNECGVVDHFEASFRYNRHSFYYSATQKKLFHNRNGRYIEGAPNDWSDTKYNSVLRKIEALYKEGKAK